MKILQSLGLISAVLLAACASQPAPQKAASLKEPPRHCLRSTGTRLDVPEGKCTSGAGRVLTREDLERSGAITTGGALNRVSPF